MLLEHKGNEKVRECIMRRWNVFILTGYSGPDPETTSENGIDNTMWPRSRTYSIRLTVKF